MARIAAIIVAVTPTLDAECHVSCSLRAKMLLAQPGDPRGHVVCWRKLSTMQAVSVRQMADVSAI